jgi:hypothetical protein
MKHIHSSTWLAMIITGMALGTAWAIRGQFGHEQGAAWAGGIGCLCLVLLAKRQDWYNKAIQAAFAGAVGWGLGGMMSYGAVVGYGRGVDLVNVYYGLLMLLVIGGLYGFVGGGMFGLVLADQPKKKVKWHQVIAEMTVGSIIFYYFIIEQLGIYMTPPRSEAWGVSAGMAIALLYYLVRTNQHAALRVAVFAALGGGFGFAFGNFLQVLGNVAQVKFNMWNVMEYSLGFFGGAGMAYAVFTSKWPKVEQPKFSNISLMIPIVGLVVLIPFFVWQQSFIMKDLQPTLEKLVEGETSTLVRIFQWLAFFAFVIPAIYWVRTCNTFKFTDKIKKKFVAGLFMGYFGIYLFFTFLITGSLLSFYRIEQFLYVLNFGLIIWFIPQAKPKTSIRDIAPVKWSYTFLGILLFLLLLSLIAINTHGEMPGMNKRFEF